MQFWQIVEGWIRSSGGEQTKIVAVLASLSRFFLATLVITYLVSMISAATAKRTLAIKGVGKMPVSIVSGVG